MVVHLDQLDGLVRGVEDVLDVDVPVEKGGFARDDLFENELVDVLVEENNPVVGALDVQLEVDDLDDLMVVDGLDELRVEDDFDDQIEEDGQIEKDDLIVEGDQ